MRIAEERSIEQPWPADEEMEKLLRRSGKLFIYAATAVKFIDNGWSPKRALATFLSANTSDSQTSHAALDAVYRKIVEPIGNLAGGNRTNEMVAFFRRVVGTVVVLQQPLTKRAIGHLLDEDVDDVNSILRPLNSVFDAGLSDDHPIRPFHLSFPDFITSRERCGDDRFYVQIEEAHLSLATQCLRVMNACLKQDICDIGDPNLLNSEVDGLASRVENRISEELRYACIYWINHLVLAPRQTEKLVSALGTFCRNHLLHWIEALSLLRQLRSAAEGIPLVKTWCEVCRRGRSYEFNDEP
jgi:hypothetical protein